jgi:hypothetical protein
MGSRPPLPDPSEVLVFRPAPAVRMLAAAFGVLCALAALYELWLFTQDGARHLLGAGVLVLPGLFALALLRRRIEVHPDALRSVTLLGPRVARWTGVRRLDQTRRSFVVLTEAGAVSAGWIDPARRDLLFRKILERAKLTISHEPARWGITAQFVPRAQPIQLFRIEKTDRHEDTN